MKTKSGEIWIIEAKGGLSLDDSSNNIDKYARHKFEALKEYAGRYPNIKRGFVRAAGIQLYLSNTVWDESLFNKNVWKPIELFI